MPFDPKLCLSTKAFLSVEELFFKIVWRVYVETVFQVLLKKLAEIVAQCSGKR